MKGSLGRAVRSESATVVDLDIRRAAAVELATRAKAGSDAAFQELARRLTPYMRFRVSRHYLPGAEQDDLHQEALLGLHKAARDFRSDRSDNFEAFAKLCIDRQVITAVKMATRQKHMILSRRADLQAPSTVEDDPIPDDHLGALLDFGSDPHDVLAGREDWDMFVQIGRSLRGMQSEVFALRLSGLSYGEIADRTGHDEKAVDNALQRVKRKFSKQMALAA